eukprot:CAMPEP_0118970352 /NCGR_PEP_ID=MMETSP1173-20130426/7277_1 /TAXON_ID=1034831 /ORGANISM="Rhizochromulina marina cf, Strain CCMP1243" /LENGTH=43 /DNA_ID= /DNA_START= /DNA_END= /DNA_ORIENTATION=
MVSTGHCGVSKDLGECVDVRCPLGCVSGTPTYNEKSANIAGVP